jgi:hypothetical protein
MNTKALDEARRRAISASLISGKIFFNWAATVSVSIIWRGSA